jgi:hypothetical protein
VNAERQVRVDASRTGAWFDAYARMCRGLSPAEPQVTSKTQARFGVFGRVREAAGALHVLRSRGGRVGPRMRPPTIAAERHRGRCASRLRAAAGPGGGRPQLGFGCTSVLGRAGRTVWVCCNDHNRADGGFGYCGCTGVQSGPVSPGQCLPRPPPPPKPLVPQATALPVVRPNLELHGFPFISQPADGSSNPQRP